MSETKVDFAALTQLPEGCDWPKRPLNSTHCSDLTYGQYMDTLNQSTGLYMAVFWPIQLGSLAIYIHRYLDLSLYEDKGRTKDARTTLIWMAMFSVFVFLMGADARS